MSGGKKKQGQQGQKHQNKTAFKIQFDPLALEIHKKVSFRGLCKRCSEQISWKLQYNKYKKMTEPARCTLCQQKNVLRTYMSACEPCSQALRICPKCLDPEKEQEIEVKLTEQEQKRQDEQSERKMNDFVKTLKQRSRRTVKRLYEKGTITWDLEQKTFLDEEGNPIPLQFRQGYGTKKDGDNQQDQQIDEFGDEDNDEEEDQNQDEQNEENEDVEEHSKEKDKKSQPKGKINKNWADEQESNEQDEDDKEEHNEDNKDQSQEDGNQKQQHSNQAQNQDDWEDENEDQSSEEDHHQKKGHCCPNHHRRHHK